MAKQYTREEMKARMQAQIDAGLRLSLLAQVPVFRQSLPSAAVQT